MANNTTNLNTTVESGGNNPVNTAAVPPCSLLSYTKAEQDTFWMLYGRIAQPAIERACRGYARSLTDNAMSADDMAAWVDDRVWKMLRAGAWPVFHDHPTPEVAAERVTQKARLWARWAHLALSRATWRRKAREARFAASMSREERLASVSAPPEDLERFEEIKLDLDRIRAEVSDRTRRNAAASWHEPADRQRIALALGAVSEQDDRAIADAASGAVKPNTLDQMRSRSRKEIRTMLTARAPRNTVLFLIVTAAMCLSVSGARGAVQREEQTGGRGGMHATAAYVDHQVARGEQTGGRPK